MIPPVDLDTSLAPASNDVRGHEALAGGEPAGPSSLDGREDAKSSSGAAETSAAGPALPAVSPADPLAGVTDPGERLYVRTFPVAIDPSGDAAGAWAKTPEWERAEWRDLAAALRREVIAECIAEAERVRRAMALAEMDKGAKMGARCVADTLRALAAKDSAR